MLNTTMGIITTVTHTDIGAIHTTQLYQIVTVVATPSVWLIMEHLE